MTCDELKSLKSAMDEAKGAWSAPSGSVQAFWDYTRCARKYRDALEDGALPLIESLAAENERLREALAWYADEANYDDLDAPGVLHPPRKAWLERCCDEESYWESDCGRRARAALAKKEEDPNV